MLETEGKLSLARFTLQLFELDERYRQLGIWLETLLNHVQRTCGSDGNDLDQIPEVVFDLSQTSAHAYTTKPASIVEMHKACDNTFTLQK